MGSISLVRMRVAKSDWCASRMVVSVSSTRFSERIQAANFSAPISLNLSRVPGGGGCVVSMRGKGAASGFASLARRRFNSGLPLTAISPMKRSSFVARSRRFMKRKSSGVSSMKRVMHSPDTN